MARSHFAIVFLLSFGLIFFSACGEKETTQRVVTAASLFKPGDWALYDLQRVNTDGSETRGTLKISAVGQDMVEGVPYSWLELREDSDKGVEITKFLAREKTSFNPEESFTFWDDVKRIIIQKDANQPEEVPQQHLRRYTPHFIESGSVKRYGNVENIEPPTQTILSEKNFTVNGESVTATGKSSVQHFSSSVNLGFLNLEDTTESSVAFYRKADLPFGGIINVTYSSMTTSVNKLKPETPPKPPQLYENSMTMKAYGTGAESQIIGHPVEMEVMPFPFLEAAKKGASGAP